MGDFDREQMKPQSDFLRLASQGEVAEFRIAGGVQRELKVWPAGDTRGKPVPSEQTAEFTPGQWFNIMANPDWKVSEVFHLPVIDRADDRPKIFTVTGGVYGRIRECATNPKWGDPRSYDITVTRTEEPGNYYSVMPSPKTPLMHSELDKIKTLDMVKLLPAARPNSAAQPEDEIVKGVTSEPLPWEPKPLPARNSMLDINKTKPAETSAEPVPDEPDDPTPDGTDTVIDDFDTDQPVNLDDIPF